MKVNDTAHSIGRDLFEEGVADVYESTGVQYTKENLERQNHVYREIIAEALDEVPEFKDWWSSGEPSQRLHDAWNGASD